MLRAAKVAIGTLVLIILLPIDLGLKALLAFSAALVLWLPFYLLTDFGLRPGLFLGLGFSILLSGLWDGCNMFHLRPVAEWAHRLVSPKDSLNNQVESEWPEDSALPRG